MELSKEFAMEDLRPTKRILGIRTTRDKMHSLLKLSQEEYLNKVLIRFNMDEAKLKITTGYAYTISGTTVSWVSRLQNIVALYTTEAKYVAMTEATKELDGKLALEKIKRYQNPIDMLMKTITIEKLKLYTTSVGLLT
ncbi:hypothetical protein CK203_021135 [Vitis vinifera]|uniref:Retrovirus-related Pol polyprotein from transposon TNT 1-94 n=1 Tax=Vitis vinifera TaxID=29760 RepID=A0A438JX34_VITVI|nr:hypothetical protein CK203_021135 [Vitis vinifera]